MTEVQPADIEERAEFLYNAIARHCEEAARVDPDRQYLMIGGNPIPNAVVYHRWDTLPGDVANSWRERARAELEAAPAATWQWGSRWPR